MGKINFESFGSRLSKNEMKLINGGGYGGGTCSGSCASTGECSGTGPHGDCLCNSMNLTCE